MALDCLTNIIGVTEDATCLPGASTASKSGLFLNDNSAGRLPVKQVFWSNIAEVNKVVPNAVKDAINALRITTEKRLQRTRVPILSTIGNKGTYTNALTSSGAGYRYMVIKPKSTMGPIININQVNIYLWGGVYTGDYMIYKGEEKIFDTADSDTLPLTGVVFDENVYIIYQVASDTTNNKPRDMKHTGCCGYVPTYDGYSYVGSGEVTDLANLDWSNSDYSQGIEAKVTFDCDGFQFLCDFDFVNNAFGIVFAKLVQQIGRRNMLLYALANDQMTAYMLSREEELMVIKEYLDKDIDDMLKFLPENYDYSDCFRCNGMAKGEIII